MNNEITKLVETRDFNSARDCDFPQAQAIAEDFHEPSQQDCEQGLAGSIPFRSPELGESVRPGAESSRSSRTQVEELFESIFETIDSEEQVFCQPAFFADDFVGKRFGAYQILERIGSGGMARVYLAMDTELKRHVAVKIIQNRNYVSLDSQARLLKAEAILQASLHHPNVVSIYHVGSQEELPFLAMEYVDGGSLLERVNDGKLTFAEILDFAKQISAGLEEAYRIGLVHGDIKPANLLVDDCGLVKLSDFGLARHVNDDDDIPRMLVGTPSYMAPELFELNPIDELSDLFSLGVTLFQLSFGRVPYVLVGETVEELKVSIQSAEIEFPDSWPADFPLLWKEILCGLLQKDRSKRFQSIAVLQHKLEKVDSQRVEAKRVPKLSSFLLENVLFGFLCLPLLGLATGVSEGAGVLTTPILVFSAITGPICFILLTGTSGRTAGQLVSNTRFSQRQCCHPGPCALVKYQLLQLLPSICLLAGVLLLSFPGIPAALTLISCGLAIAICHAFDVLLKGNEMTFMERVCHVQTIVDI